MATVVAVLGVVTASAAGAPAEVSIPLLLGGGVGASSRDKEPIISFTPPALVCCVVPVDMFVDESGGVAVVLRRERAGAGRARVDPSVSFSEQRAASAGL
jgi:hypothetical protein